MPLGGIIPSPQNMTDSWHKLCVCVLAFGSLIRQHWWIAFFSTASSPRSLPSPDPLRVGVNEEKTICLHYSSSPRLFSVTSDSLHLSRCLPLYHFFIHPPVFLSSSLSSCCFFLLFLRSLRLLPWGDAFLMTCCRGSGMLRLTLL